MNNNNEIVLNINRIKLLLEAKTELGITAREYLVLPEYEDIIRNAIERMSSYNDGKKYSIVDCEVSIPLEDGIDVVALNRILLDSKKTVKIKFNKVAK